MSTSTFGVGQDFDERLLIRMADAGGGSYHFIEDGDGIMAAVQAEVGETLAVVAREVVVVVEPSPGVEARSLNEHTVVRGGGGFEVRVGSLYAGQQSAAMLEVTLPKAPLGTRHCLAVRVADRDGACPGEPLLVELVVADDREVDHQERDLGVARRVAEVLAARAVDAALERNREGDFNGAVRAIRDAANAIRGWGTGDDTIRAVVRDLELRVDRYSRPVDPMTRKRHTAGSYDLLRSKKSVLRSMFLKRGSAVVLPRTTTRLSALVEEVAGRVRAAGSLFSRLRVDDGLAVRFGAEPFAAAEVLTPKLERDLCSAVDGVWDEQDAHVRIVFDLCDDCRARLDEWGMPRETLDALADTIRDLATRTPVKSRRG